MLLEQALAALTIVTDPTRLGFIALGASLGLFVGVIPGIGGIVGLALMLPFTFSMDPYTAIAFLIGLSAVTVTSDTIPAVLFGVPGTVGSAATVLDGHPMARRGEAGRAFGAAFTASVLGGLFGALLLAVSIPVLRPLMLAVGTPELLAVCALGLTLVAALSHGSLLKGLLVACLGILLATIGDEAQTGELRWTFDSMYLWDGIPLVSLALGLFAIPELIDLAVSRKSVAGENARSDARQQLQGVRDVFANKLLVIRSASIGSVLGSIPGIGAAVIDWVAYGAAARTMKGAAQSFGTGDVRGVIASESSNNAKEGGALIPTLAFGVPGSASMALLLGAFMMHGIAPGPKMLGEHLDITYTLVWSVAIANLFGASICFLFANQLARLATVRAGILVPLVLGVTVVGAYQGARDIGDLGVLFGFGILGWLMKRFGWARPPLVLGFVLGGLLEGYLFISMRRYGFDWMARPGVVVLGGVLVLTLCWPLLVQLRKLFSRRDATKVPGRHRRSLRLDAAVAGDLALWLLFGATFIYALASSLEWELAARLMPWTVAGIGLALIAMRALSLLLPVASPVAGLSAGGAAENDPLADLDGAEIGRRFVVQLAWILALLAGIVMFGMLPAIGVFMLAYLLVAGGTRTWVAFAIVVPIWVGMLLLFDQLLHIPWPDSWLGDLLPRPLPQWVERLL